MTHRSLLPIPDNTRRAWCILTLTTTDDDGREQIIGWGLGDANQDTIVETAIDGCESSADKETTLRSLCMELNERQYTDQVLITQSSDTLPLLRTELLESSFGSPSLRGFRHLSLESLAKCYFDDDLILAQVAPRQSKSSEEKIEELWQLRKCMGSLVPVSALRGTPL